MPIEFDDLGVPKLATRHPDGTTLREIYQMVKDEASRAPEGGRLECFVEGAMISVLGILQDVPNQSACAINGGRQTNSFVLDVMRLEFSLRALWDQFKICCRGHDWPKTPTLVFASRVRDSALELIFEFGCALHSACIECESMVLRDRALNNRIALMWKDEALREIKSSLLPREDHLSHWQVAREWMIVQVQFRDELRRSKTSPEASGKAAAGSRAPRMTLKEANIRARQLLKEHPGFADKSAEEWSREIPCSIGLVSYLPTWEAVMERTGRGRKGRPARPKVVSLPADELLGRTSNLEELIAQQRADDEPSPLDHDPPLKHLEAPKVRKKV